MGSKIRNKLLEKNNNLGTHEMIFFDEESGASLRSSYKLYSKERTNFVHISINRSNRKKKIGNKFTIGKIFDCGVLSIDNSTHNIINSLQSSKQDIFNFKKSNLV